MNRANDQQLSVLVWPLTKLGAYDEAALKAGLSRNPGVKRVEVSLLEDRVSVFYEADTISEAGLQAALGRPDYLVPGTGAALKRLMASHGLTIRLAGSALLLAGVLATNPSTFALLLVAGMVLLSLPAFLRCMVALFTRGQASADLLVWIIAVAALGMSRWAEASCVIFLSVFADFLRVRTFQPTRLAGANEASLLARRISIRDGHEIREISLSDIRKDQIVVVRQGQMVPVDGVVAAGKAEVRDAALTGESTYQTRTEGQPILAGTMVESGALDIRVVRVGKDTLLASIDRLVNRALCQGERTNHFMDKFIRVYLLAVALIAVLVFAFFGQHVFWSSETSVQDSLHTVLGLLMAACPLALVLVGPLTLYAGLLRAARNGILFKGGAVLEKLASVRVLLLDKTGTLTYAQPKVASLTAFSGFAEQEVLEAALFVERQSSHPIARAVCEYGATRTASVRSPDKFLEFEGGGACATQGDYYIKVGALWLMEDGREISQEAQDWMAGVRAKGLSFVLIANRTQLLGGLVLEDALRENARAVVDGVRDLGIQRVIMITGDNQQTAERVQKAVGIDEMEAECMPDRKLVRIQQERRQGRVVAMVGDGINDAPALAAADVGIAMGTHSSDLAVEAADVALINNDLNDLYEALNISGATARFIRIGAIVAVLGNFALLALSLLGVIDLVGGVLLQLAVLAAVALLAALLYTKRTI